VTEKLTAREEEVVFVEGIHGWCRLCRQDGKLGLGLNR